MSFSEPFELDFKISFSCLTWRPNMGIKAASQRTTAYLFYSPSGYRTYKVSLFLLESKLSAAWHLLPVYAKWWTRTKAFLSVFPGNTKQFQSMPTLHWLPRQLLLRDCLGNSWFVGGSNCLTLHHFFCPLLLLFTY